MEEVSSLSIEVLKWELKQRIYTMGIHGISRSDIPDDPFALVNLYDKFIPLLDKRAVMVDKFVNNMSNNQLSEKYHKSPQTIYKWVRDFIEDYSYRSYAIFIEKGKLTDQSSIRGIFKISYNGIRRLENYNFYTVKDLRDSFEGCTDVSLKRDIPLVNKADREILVSMFGSKRGKVSSSKQKEDDKPIFVVLKTLQNRYQGVEITNKGVLHVSYLSVVNSKKYHLESVESLIKKALVGDIDIRSFEGIPKMSWSSIEAKGIKKLSDFASLTREEVENLKYLGALSVDSIEEELIYRFGKGFKQPDKPKVKDEVKNQTNFLSVVERNDLPLPTDFLVYTMGTKDKNLGTCTELDILNMYSDYLEFRGREDDWLILQGILEKESNVPVGIISLMEETKNNTYPMGIISDYWGLVLLQSATTVLAEGLTRYQVTCVQQLYLHLLKKENVNLPDLINFCKSIQFVISTNKLVYIYKNYRNDGDLFLRRPPVSDHMEKDCVRKLKNNYSYLPDKELSLICSVAKRLDVPYDYISSNLDYYLDTKKVIGGTVSMLASWFNFDCKAMKIYLSQNPNFGDNMEVW